MTLVIYKRGFNFWYTTLANYEAYCMDARKEHRFPNDFKTAEECAEYLKEYICKDGDNIVIE